MFQQQWHRTGKPARHVIQVSFIWINRGADLYQYCSASTGSTKRFVRDSGRSTAAISVGPVTQSSR